MPQLAEQPGNVLGPEGGKAVYPRLGQQPGPQHTQKQGKHRLEHVRQNHQ